MKKQLSVQQIIGMALGLFLIFMPLACSTKTARSLKKASTNPKAPSVDEMTPAYGPPGGGTFLLVTGTNFVEDETTVFFGTEEANDVVWVSATQLKVEAPSGSLGDLVDLVVEAGDGESALRGIKRESFQYEGIQKSTVVFLGCFIFFLALLGLPLFLVISAATLLGYILTSQEEAIGFFQGVTSYGQSKAGLGSTIFNWVTDMGGKPLFIAIPLFTFAGSLMSESGAPTRLVNVARSLVGWFPGGLAWVTLLVCCFFTAFTGASGVTIIALGGLLFPILVKEGYGENYSLGLLTTGGSLGLLIPPSLPVIVYGIIAGLDADHIWDAGVGPMILIVLLLGGHAVFVAMRAKVPTHSSSGAEIWAAIKAAAFEIPLPIVVVFGIKGGYVTATEASAVTAFWVLIVEVFVYKDISLKELPGVIRRSMILVGGLIIIIGFALAFTTYLTKNDVPQRILGVMQQSIDNQLAFLLMLNFFLLIVGCLMDIFSAILVVVPLIAPVALGFGVDPYHLAIIFLVNLEIGYSTPPVGINLFISSMRFNRPVFQMYRASIVFIFILLIGLIVITYVPSLTIGRFDLPKVQIVDQGGKVMTEGVKIIEGKEQKLVCQAAIGGISLVEAKKNEAEALKLLQKKEAETKLNYDDLMGRLAVAKTLIASGSAKAEDISKAKADLAEIETKKAPLNEVAVDYTEKKQFRVALESLRSTARWSCRLHSDFDETGEELDLSELEPGKHRIALTGTTDKKHLSQTLIDVEVTADPNKKDDDDDDE
jgi:C4-dicarboxylate transporter, DctM subunit